jgi:Flagellar hook-length control protein FliK
MPISVSPTIPVIAAQAVAPDLVLQPGTVVDAEVLKLLSDNLVRIAIAGFSIDVFSEIPLSAGQALQLAVSQTEGGIRLAVVGQGAGAAAGASSAGPSSAGIFPEAVTLAPNAPGVAANPPLNLAPNAPVDAVANPSLNVTPLRNELTPLERVAVATAAEGAATQQGSQAPLFANLAAVAAFDGLPPKLQQAVLQVLAQQTSLDQNLTGSDVKNAFQKSGLLLEASLASASALPAAGVPDLKAALIVLRQTLLSSLGTGGAGENPAASVKVAGQPILPGAASAPDAPTSAPASVASAPDAAPPPHAAPPQHAAPTSTLAPSLSPNFEMQEILLPQARVPVANDSFLSGGPVRIVLPETLLHAGPRTMTAGAALNLLQEALQESPDVLGNPSPATAMLKGGRSDDVTFHTNTPPPPFRGALPAAQPVATPSIALDAPLATTAHHLLDDTDAAIARQTLLQVASLPDRVDTAGVRTDPTAPRWHFEIPFATPLGTAIAQFEISRDRGGSEVEAAKRVWRARFSLDVEPAGPVHALVSLSGDKTSVRIWAERPATAAQLRAGSAQLSQALSKAELRPGDIVIRDGTPPQSAPARAGHFLDRAL